MNLSPYRLTLVQWWTANNAVFFLSRNSTEFPLHSNRTYLGDDENEKCLFFFFLFVDCRYRFPHICWPLNEYAKNKRWEFITFILNRSLPIFILSMIKTMSHVSLFYFVLLFFRVFSFCIAVFASLSFRCEHVNAIHLTYNSNSTQFNSMILKLHVIP